MSENPTGPTGTSATEAAAAIDHDETVALLQALVRIESPYFEEAEITRFVYDWLDARGHDPAFHAVSEPEITGYEGRNVLARLAGSDPDAPTLLLNAHVDTVQLVDAWTEDPLSGRIEDGRCYGQGAADMKAGLAATMVAFDVLADADLAGDVLLTAVVDEEGPYGLGTDALVRDGLLDDCDVAVVPEPGPLLAQGDVENPALFLGARGRFLYDVVVHGEAGHASTPESGVNAVVDAGRLAGALAEMPVGDHPKLGPGSVCPLRIEGGSETITVPARCRLLADRHVVPDETVDDVLEQAETVAADLDVDSAVDVGLRDVPYPGARYGPYVLPEDHPLVCGLSRATEVVAGHPPELGYFRSVGDFNYLGHRAEIPTVILGPDGGNIHAADEWVDVEETVEVARILAAGAVELLS